MVNFISQLINNSYLATLIMSLVPLIELKGAIVFARGVGFGFFTALGLSFLGSTIVFIPIYWLLKPILRLLKKIKFVNSFAVKIEVYFENKAQETLQEQQNKNKNSKLSATFIKQLGVFIFVAIPLPMTGVWTGTAIAVFLGLKFRDVILPVALGNLVAGLIISLLAELCLAFWTIAVLDYILYGLFALAIILFVITIVKISLKKPTKTETENKD